MLEMPEKKECHRHDLASDTPRGPRYCSHCSDIFCYNAAHNLWLAYHTQEINKLKLENAHLDQKIVGLWEGLPRAEEIVDILHDCIKGSKVWEMMNGRIDLIPLATAIFKRIQEGENDKEKIE